MFFVREVLLLLEAWSLLVSCPQIHHDLAIYHEIGRFSGQLEPFDVEAVMFHEQQAAELGVKDAIVTLANIFLGMPHDCLSSITVAVILNKLSLFSRIVELL